MAAMLAVAFRPTRRNRIAASCQRSQSASRRVSAMRITRRMYFSRERGRDRGREDPTRRMPRVFSRWSDRPGMRELRFVSQPRQIFPGHENEDRASRVVGSRCQEIYLRRRQHVFGRPRPAANNSLIYLYSPLKLAARHLLAPLLPFVRFSQIPEWLYVCYVTFRVSDTLKTQDAPLDAITWDPGLGFRALISYINAPVILEGRGAPFQLCASISTIRFPARSENNRDC